MAMTAAAPRGDSGSNGAGASDSGTSSGTSDSGSGTSAARRSDVIGRLVEEDRGARQSLMAPPRGLRLRHPARLVVAGFAGVILIGAVLLCLPVATNEPGGASFHIAIFQATGAVTLSGMSLVDVATYWSPTGQAIILVLVEIGGLGIVTSALLLFLLVARRVGLRSRLVAQAEIHTFGLGGMRRLILAIVGFTLAFQALASLALFLLLLARGRSAGTAAWEGVFHGIAAFNNAGISIFPGGMAAFVDDPGVLATVAVAVIVGGLGFPVWLDVWRHPRHPSRWTVHVKLTLGATAILLVIGIVVVTSLEWSNPGTLGALSVPDRLANGAFAGVMPRTAGFSTLDYGGLQAGLTALHGHADVRGRRKRIGGGGHQGHDARAAVPGRVGRDPWRV